MKLAIPRLGDPVLAPGDYLYAGSANGPGGIRARVARHLRRDKPLHWHIDRLSAVAVCADIEVRPDGRECDFVAEWIAKGALIPVPRFGSTDCRTCAAHLLQLAAPPQNRDIARP